MTQAKGKLYLIPSTLGDGTAPLEVLPISVKEIITDTKYFIVENEKSFRRFVKAICPNKKQASLHIKTLNKFTNALELQNYLDPCQEGHNIGIVSEAGCPVIADPGSAVVELAHQKNIRVVPMVGPSSIILSLMASGFNGQNFAFNGYLPIDKTERKSFIKKLEKLSLNLSQTQIFIETPYRNDKLLADILQALKPSTHLCVACDISLPTEFIQTKTAAEWKQTKVDLHKRPTIFLLQA
ncbi:MAG: SAM-dependent methyltransferase [Flavobacteriaceae bacterium]|nr:SAM-dependent methyltransferase [Flavobacteriaceae bacterium]